MNEELRNALKNYYERFGDIFPTMEIGFRSDKHLISMIKKCLEQGKPAEEVFHIEYGPDILY